jgi:hypothetical protein
MMKNKSPKEKYTIEFIENKIETKLTYPFQFLEDVNLDDDNYKELIEFGCSDIISGCHWIHRDCFSKKCSKCNFYPIVEKYYIENDIDINQHYVIPINKLSTEEAENQLKKLL